MRSFARCLPQNWVAEKVSSDYGVDLRVDIFDGASATGLELLVQLKACAASAGPGTETVRLRTSTYNYLRDKLQVVMLVKYVAAEDEAYWILLSEIPKPNQENETFTVRIPKTKRLSHMDWQDMQDYVRGVSNQKLAARRRASIQSKRG